MSSSMRIVLVDPLGEILFSGESMSVTEATSAPPRDAAGEQDADDEDMCPETMRSAGSGVYRAVHRSAPPEVAVTEATEADDSAYDTEVPTQKRGGRAA